MRVSMPATAPLPLQKAASIACPLCDSSQSSIFATRTISQLLLAWKTIGVTLSQAALGPMAGLEEVHLHECHDCGFLFFDGASAACDFPERSNEPAGLLAAAARRAPPGGYVADAVPNRSGVHGLCRADPHRWPPHQVSRCR